MTGEKAIDQARLKSAAYLYAKAKTSAKKLVKLNKNTEVEVLSRTGSWSKVRYDRQTGYIQNKALTFFKGTKTEASYEKVEAAEETPTPTPEIFIPTPTPTPTPTPEVFIPTPTPEIFIPTPEPEA